MMVTTSIGGDPLSGFRAAFPGYRISSLLYQSARTTIFRAVDVDHTPVLIKIPTTDNPSLREIARYQRTFEIVRQVDERVVVTHKDVLRHGASISLVMEDSGAVTLASCLPQAGLLPIRWLELAVELATIIGRLHASGVVHMNLNPHHVVVHPGFKEPLLIDLGHAIRLRRETAHPAATQADGMLAYMSPEQCGLIDVAVDQRADLYSLGVILFEMATGRIPFPCATATELVHAHVAASPLVLSSLRKDFPAMVSDIVARLLAKNVDERYSSAQGLAHDLNLCLTQLQRQGAVRPFPLGQVDASSSFRIHDRLYGREDECAQLLEALVLASNGERVFLTVSGTSGIGKTALVSDLGRRVDDTRCRVCSGKFDQFGAEIPYLGVLQAFSSLLRYELAQPSERLALRATQLREALGTNGLLLTTALPELELIVGPQPPLEDVAPRDAVRRLNLLVGRFLGVFASRDQPLLMFLDDLQWADPPSVQLIEALALDPALDHLLLVASYRANEVGLGHPLQSMLERLREASPNVVEIKLEPLSKDAVQQMLANTLRAETKDLRVLADHVHDLSAGNPFFVGEFLYALHERGFFHYDEQGRSWGWDFSRIHEFSLPDNVAALVADRLESLPTGCLVILDTASCIGCEFDLQTLASVHDAAQNVIAVALAPAVRSGVIVPLDHQYELFESLDGWNLTELDTAELGTARYRFQHDSVRQIVHERLDTEQRAQRHLHIGRLFLQKLAQVDVDRRVIEVFMHVVEGAHLLEDSSERHQLAAVGLVAGQRAQRCLAFELALQMLDTAAAMLAPSAWTDDYTLAFGIHLARAQCAYALMRWEDFNEAVTTVIGKAHNVVYSAEAYGLQIRMLHSQNRFAEAVDIGTNVAARLGVRLPRRPKLPQVLWGAIQALVVQQGRNPLELVQIGEASGEQIRSAVSLLTSIASSAYFAEPNLLPLIATTCTCLSIRHGITPHSPYGFAVWALVLCGSLGRIESGYHYGLLALEIGRRYGGAEEARARFVVNCFVRHWKEPLPDVAQLLHADWARNRENGDTENATYSAGSAIYTHFFAGGSLDALERYSEPIRYIISSEQTQVKDCFMAWVELFAALRNSELPGELDGDWFSYPSRLPELEAAHNVVQVAMSSIPAGLLDFFASRYERAERRFALAAHWEDHIVAQVLVPGLAFFRALNAYRRLAAGLAGSNRHSALRMARRQRARLARWAAFSPANLAARVSLLDAEHAALHGHTAYAVLLLHRAIEQASGGALLYQALAEHRLAIMLKMRGLSRSASDALVRSADCFQRWGSEALADQVAGREVGGSSRPTDLSSPASADLMGSDIKTLCDAIATISSEIDEQELLRRLMPTMMHASGADRGLLLLLDPQSRLWIEAEASLTETASRRISLDDFANVSRRAVDFALRSRQPVVIHDAPAANLLAGEDYSRVAGVAAILAISIAVRGRGIGVLYLENHCARHAFTPKRVEVTLALGVQVGIALENARLYGRVAHALTEQSVLAEANQRFVPQQILSGLGVNSIVDVQLNDAMEHEMNVLFVDLRDFTALSIARGPRGTIEMINRYLSHVQPGIVAYGGFVSQYFGDGVLALFPNDADDALRGAMAMCRGLEGYNRERGGDFPELRFGMGLHSGPITLGTIGDPDHFQCGVVGQSVNLASRMEGLTKHFGATLVVSGATQARLSSPELFGLRPLGWVEVAGCENPIEVFECLSAYPDDVAARIMANDILWQEALAAHQAGEWEYAWKSFSACVQACQHDQVARSFVSRCQQHWQAGLSWDGIERPAK